HLWHIGEDVEPERVVAAQERALARSHVSGEPEGDAALAPVPPVRIRREAGLDPEPSRRADDDERQRGDCAERASRESPRSQALDECREDDSDADRKSRVELERVADRLRRDADAEELLGDQDRAEKEE